MAVKTVEKLLQEVGFSPKEQAVYLATLELGEAPVSPIARRAHINRGTAYDILKSLIEKGLVAKAERKKVLHYSAIGTESLENYIQTQKTDWEEKLEGFKLLEPELHSLLGSAGVKPIVRFFEGRMGVKEAFFDQIRGEHKEILSYSTASKIQQFFGENYLKVYTKQKIRTGIINKVISPEEKALAEYLDKYYSTIKERFIIKAVPQELFPWEAEMNIYGHKVSLMTLDEKNPVAVIIESPALAKSQRLIFELLWKKLD